MNDKLERKKSSTTFEPIDLEIDKLLGTNENCQIAILRVLLESFGLLFELIC